MQLVFRILLIAGCCASGDRCSDRMCHRFRFESYCGTVCYRPVRNSGRVAPVISAVGIGYVMRNIIQLIWGAETFSFDLGIFGTGSIQIGNAVVRKTADLYSDHCDRTDGSYLPSAEIQQMGTGNHRYLSDH